MSVEFHWLRPAILLLLLLVPLCYYLLRRWQPADGWQQLLAPHLYRQLVSQQVSKRRPLWLPLLLAIGVIAAAGPSWQKLPQPAFVLNRATVLVMDMSMSMRATDVKPNRLTQARFKALDFIKAQPEGDMALLAFAGDAYVISPLTPDHNNLALLLPDLAPEIMPAQGSDLGTALTLADQVLQQAGHSRGDIILFTDGFVREDYTRLQDQIRALPHRVSVIAFGSSDGAPVQLVNGELLKDNRGSIVLPKVPLSQLQALAVSGGGVYAHASFADDDIKALLQLAPLGADKQTEKAALSGEQWRDGGIYLVYLLLALTLWAGRRQSLFAVPLLLLPLATLLPSNAQADDWQWQDLWQSRQSQAKQAYDAGDYQQAQQKFSNQLWQGNAAYRQGDFAGAAAHYQQDPSADGRFNLGNSLALQGDYAGALKAYEEAAKQNATLPGLAENKALIERLLQQQQQQQSQSGDKQSEQQKQDQQNDGQPQNGQQQQDGEQSSQQQQSGDQQSEQADPQASQQTEQQAKQQSQKAQQQQAQAAEADPQQQEQQQKAVEQAWPNATAEESQQLENLLRKVQDDPSLLLKNKMLLEYQKRQHQASPRGAIQEW